MDPQNCLRPVELDMSGLVLLGSGFFDKFNEFFQNLTGQVAAAPVECKCFILLCSLQGALVNFLRLCEGKFFLFIVKVITVGREQFSGTGCGYCDCKDGGTR